MLTLFCIPKPFRREIATIQRNAIQSWTRLQPVCEIILFGDEEGIAEAAAEFGVRHVPYVERNEYGTPLMNSLFRTAEQIATQPLLGYVNADIILLSDFMRAAARTRVSGRVLVVGQRWDVDLRGPWDFRGDDWEERLRAYVATCGVLHPLVAMDYFLFPHGLWENLPPLAIGRTAWDNWLVYQARSRGAWVVDATPVVLAIHQNHDHDGILEGQWGVWKGPEANRNLELAGGEDHVFTLLDATHMLTCTGFEPTFIGHSSKRPVDTKSLEEYRLLWAKVLPGPGHSSDMGLVRRHAVASSYWYQGHLERESRHAWAALRSVRRAHALVPEAYRWDWGWALQFWLHTYIRYPFWMVPYWAARKIVRQARRVFRANPRQR